MFLSSQSMVSYVSLLSSMSLPFLAGLHGRMLTKVPSDIQRPRTS